jgi:hypothetical protein
LLQHAPPPAQRLAQRRLAQTDAGALLWQIHQLLDQDADRAAETAQLRSVLQRTLAEKAQLAEELRRFHESAQALPAMANNKMGWMQPLRAQAGQHVAMWRHGNMLFSKLPIVETPLRQQFQAQHHFLCGVELMFSPYAGTGGGTVEIALYEESQDGQPLATAVVAPREIALEQPYVLACPPQIFSQGRTYIFTIAANSSADFPHGVWRARKSSAMLGRLWLGPRVLSGQLYIRPIYASVNTASAAEQPPARMVTPRAVTEQAVEEMQRLARKTGHIVQNRGLRGLLNEAFLYIRWQLFYKQGKL